MDKRDDYMVTSNRESGFGRYDAALLAKGIAKERIRYYGFVFEGNKVLIG